MLLDWLFYLLMMKEGIYMLKNIKENKNIIIPFAPQNDSVQVQAGGVLAWSGYVAVWKSTNDESSVLKNKMLSFRMKEAPVS